MKNIKNTLSKLTSLVRFYFIAPWPRHIAKHLSVMTVLFNIMITLWAVLTIFPCEKPLFIKIAYLILFLAFLPAISWFSYFQFHFGIAATEGIMIAIFKMKDAWKESKAVTPATRDFFISRLHYENEGLLVSPKLIDDKYPDTVNLYWDQVQRGLIRFMKNYSVLTDNLSETEIIRFSSNLIALKRGQFDADMVKPIRKEKISLRLYELLTVTFDFFPQLNGKVQNKMIAEMISMSFPSSYKAKTVAENLARLRQTAKEQISGTEYIRKQKSSKTEVPILPIDILNNSDKYFYELGEQN